MAGMYLIGVDCATNEKNVGLALSTVEEGRLTLRKIAAGGQKPVVEILAGWLSRCEPALLGLDAPLGWPIAMGRELSHHQAGMGLMAVPDAFFSRQTDRVIKEKLGKRPLEVGANLIARTAHAALDLLAQLRDKTGLALPLAWDAAGLTEPSAIEVYPAATMLVYGIHVPGYRKPQARTARQELADRLSRHIRLKVEPAQLAASPHLLDAALCTLAAYDFLLDRCIRPEDEVIARKEGWIWVREPEG